MEQLLFQIERMYNHEQIQPYLEKLYKTIFMFMYYGMLRVGEVAKAKGGHTLKAMDVHTGTNKNKILLVLYTSKTHGLESRPQQIRISPTANTFNILSKKKHFCPFDTTSDYLEARGRGYFTLDEQFFIFADRSPVTDVNVRRTLRLALAGIGLDPSLYDTHSFRIGRATDLQKMGCPLETIKHIGRWRSNAVYKYLRN